MLSRSGIKASHEQDLSVGPVASGLGSNIVLEIKSCRFLRSCHHFLASLHPVQRQLAHVAVVEKGAHQIDHRTARKQAQWMNRQRFCLLAALRTATSLDTAPVCKRGLDNHQHACRPFWWKVGNFNRKNARTFLPVLPPRRSAERRVGNECVSTRST